jgi:uncharacterized protein YdbL (DUF1318 family)
MSGLRILFVAWLAIASAASAQSAVSGAIAGGAVGERYDGYLGIAAPVPPAVQSGVGHINIQRRALYSRLGEQKRVSRQDVGIAAGCQLLARVAVGQSYLLSDGVWRRRAAGQAAPVPDYCR